MIKRVVIIHGIGGLSREPYFPHLKSFCEGLGLEVIMPELGGYRQNINYDTWATYFDENIKHKLNKETLVIAQSIGTNFIVRYLLNNDLSVGAYISCAGASNCVQTRSSATERVKLFAPAAKTFKITSDEFESFKKLGFQKYSLYSDNDMFFEQNNLENYSKAIGSHPMLIKGKGHFCYDDGVFELTELEELVSFIVRNN